MKKYYLLLAIAVFIIGTSSIVFGAKPAPADPEELSAKLVSGIRALEPAITAVRPAYMIDYARVKFRTQWNPAITLRKGVSIEQQKEIVKKVAGFVVQFQDGVPTDGVYGGMILFVEGEGWTPQIGQVYYKIDENHAGKVEAWTGLNIVSEEGNVSCCNDGEVIGAVVGSKFVPTKK